MPDASAATAAFDLVGELTKRILSGVILAALLLGDLWIGKGWFAALLAVGALLLLREFMRLVWRGWRSPSARVAWFVFAVAYIGAAVAGLWFTRSQDNGFLASLLLFAAVWATDIGGFVAGRSIGGPKIAPRISPNKTWAGYFGAIVATVLVVFAALSWQFDAMPWDWHPVTLALYGSACMAVATVAQAGDFFESWLKRRAGMKDSGSLIPGHGGLFDRVDGLLPVAAIFPPLLQIVSHP